MCMRLGLVLAIRYAFFWWDNNLSNNISNEWINNLHKELKKANKKTVTYPESIDFLWVTKFFSVWLRCGDFSRSGPGSGVAVLLRICVVGLWSLLRVDPCLNGTSYLFQIIQQGFALGSCICKKRYVIWVVCVHYSFCEISSAHCHFFNMKPFSLIRTNDDLCCQGRSWTGMVLMYPLAATNSKRSVFLWGARTIVSCYYAASL